MAQPSFNRKSTSKKLIEIIQLYNLDLKQIAKDTGIDMVTLKNLSKFTPHLRTVEKLSRYLENIAKNKGTSIRQASIRRYNNKAKS